MSPCAAGGVGVGATATAAVAPPSSACSHQHANDNSNNQKDVCWICLEDAETESGDAQTVLPCRCPRPVHPRCLARWQLQQAGREEERRCRFCRAELADWRMHLTPEALRPEVDKVRPVMVVYFEGQIHRIPVDNRGQGGLEDFTKKIRELFRLPEDVDISLTFGCKEPMSGSQIKLEGTGAFGAAVHCASVAAAERQARQRKQAAAAGVKEQQEGGAEGQQQQQQAPPPPPAAAPRAASSPDLATAAAAPSSPATPAPRLTREQEQFAENTRQLPATAARAPLARPGRPRPSSAPRRTAAAPASQEQQQQVQEQAAAAEGEEEDEGQQQLDSPPRRRRTPSRLASRRLSHISQQEADEEEEEQQQQQQQQQQQGGTGGGAAAAARSAAPTPTPLHDHLAALLPPVVSQLLSISRKVARSLSFTGGAPGAASSALAAALIAAAPVPAPAVGASPRNPVGATPVSPRTLSLYSSLSARAPSALVAPLGARVGSDGGAPSPAAVATPPALARPRADA